MTKTPHDSAYWDYDEVEEEIDADSGVQSGHSSDDYTDGKPSKADQGFNR